MSRSSCLFVRPSLLQAYNGTDKNDRTERQPAVEVTSPKRADVYAIVMTAGRVCFDDPTTWKIAALQAAVMTVRLQRGAYVMCTSCDDSMSAMGDRTNAGCRPPDAVDADTGPSAVRRDSTKYTLRRPMERHNGVGPGVGAACQSPGCRLMESC